MTTLLLGTKKDSRLILQRTVLTLLATQLTLLFNMAYDPSNPVTQKQRSTRSHFGIDDISLLNNRNNLIYFIQAVMRFYFSVFQNYL